MGQAPTNALAVDYTYRKQQKERKYHTLHSHSERTHIRRCTPFIKQSLPRAMSVDFAREDSSDSDHLEPLQLRQFVGILSSENAKTLNTNEQSTDSLIDDSKGSNFEEDADGFHLSGDYDEFPMEIDMESLKQLLIQRLSIEHGANGDEEAESDDDEEEEEYDCLIHAENEYTQTPNYHQATQSLEIIMNEDGAFKSISEMMFGQHVLLEPDTPDIDELDEHIMDRQDVGDNDELQLELKSQSETTIGTETETFSSMHTSQSLSHSKNYGISQDIDIPEPHTHFIAHGGNVKTLKIRI